MTKLYLHPANRRDNAPAGTILTSDNPEDDGEGAAMIRIDPEGVALDDDEKDAIAAEICRRWNYIPPMGAGASNPAAVNYAPLRRTGPDANAPDFSAQSDLPMDWNQRHNWIRDTTREFCRRGATEVRAAMDDENNPTKTLMEGWIVYPETPPPPRFLAVPKPAEG